MLKPPFSNFRIITAIISYVPILTVFMVPRVAWLSQIFVVIWLPTEYAQVQNVFCLSAKFTIYGCLPSWQRSNKRSRKQLITASALLVQLIILAPLWKSGGYTGIALSFRDSVTLSFCNALGEIRWNFRQDQDSLLVKRQSLTRTCD